MIARRGPKYPKKGKNLRPKAKNQADQNAAFGGSQATTTAVGTTGCGGCHGHGGPCFPRLLVFLRVPLRLPTVLLQFRLLYCNVSGHSETTEYTPILHATSFIVLQFQREKEGAAKNCEDFIPGFDRKTGTHFWLSFSFPSPFFSQSKFMFCNFALNLQSES